MNNALATIQSNEWDTMLSMARVLVQSKFLPNAIQTPEQAVTIMLAGRAIGVDAWTALQNINVIQGKPTVNPQLMLALIRNSGQLTDIEIIGDAQKCSVTMQRRGEIPHAEVFTMQDANQMGLSGKDNWKKQPAVMLKWRAVSACARVVFPDVILGMYVPEEMGASVDPETGEIIAQDAPQRAETPATVQIPATVASDAPAALQPVPGTEPLGPYVSNSKDWATVKRDTLADCYDGNTFHQNGSIEKGLADGWLTEDMTVSGAIMAIRIHRREFDALKLVFPRVEAHYKNPKKDDRFKQFVTHSYRLVADGKISNIEDADQVVAQVQLDLMGELAK